MIHHPRGGREGAVAVILARAGSKGVPGKNIACVGGKPCIAWTIEAAQRSELVSETLVSTDDRVAREIAVAMGARVVDRPSALASDSATVDDAVRHAVGVEGGPPVVVLYANVPVRPADLIDRAVAMLMGTGSDSVQSYCPVGKHHPWWTVRVDGEDAGGTQGGVVRAWEGDVLYHGVYRRQELPRAFVPDGGVTAVTRRALFQRVPGVRSGPHAFLGVDRRAVLTGEGDVVDIDSRIDLLVADAILREPRDAEAHSLIAGQR